MPRRLNIEQLEKKWPAMPRVESRYLSRIPAIVGLVGSTGSGKSVLAVSLIEMLRREGSVTRVFVISPTAISNQVLNAICTSDRDWKIPLTSKVFSDLARIEEACEADAKIYYDDLLYKITRDRYVNGETMNERDEHLLESRGFMEVKPVRPSPCLLLDDCQGGPIFSNSSKNAFTSLVLRSRHIGQGTGLTLMIAAQASRGIPRGLRLNMTHLFLWKTLSLKEKKNLYEDVGSLMTEDEFSRKLDLYTSMPHSYMFIDLWRRSISDSF